MLKIALFLLIVTAGSSLLTATIRRYALARSLLDIPNERSSHSAPIPRGGGVAIVLTYLGSLPFLWVWGGLSTPTLVGFTGAGLVVAMIGFLDDHENIPARWRLTAHFLGAGWVLFWTEGLPSLAMFGWKLDFGWLGYGLAAVYLVWLLNLYNFMDGIDGMAAIEAITVSISGAFLSWRVAPDLDVWVLQLLLAASVVGFLFWNFPPAKLFMGDAGSGFLGLMLGALSIQAGQVVPHLLWSWVILLGVFVVDATVTLLRRIRRGERFYKAHRNHAYQYASRLHRSHKRVSLAVGVINIFWLFPMAFVVAEGFLDGLTGVGIAYAPLIMVAFRYKAGAWEMQEV